MSQRRRVVKQPKRLIHEIGPSSQEPEQSKKRKFTRETQYPSHVRKHLNDYQSLCVRYEDLLVKAPDLSGPALDPAYIQATKDLGDMHAMISDFGRQFEKKLASYEDSCERLERANRQRPDWWQHINLFSPTLPKEYLKQLEGNPPTNSSEWAKYLSSHLNEVIYHLDPNHTPSVGQEYLRSPSYHQTKFLPRFSKELRRLGNMEDGEQHAIALILKAKYNYLHCGFSGGREAAAFVSSGHSSYEPMHVSIDKRLAEILQSIRSRPLNMYIRNRRQDPPWINAAMHCRNIYGFFMPGICLHDNHIVFALAGCVRANFVHALDMLQRHAYAEIKANVYHAVGRRLPKELTDLIFHSTLLAEDIPQDPRLIKRRGRVDIDCNKLQFSVPVREDWVPI